MQQQMSRLSAERLLEAQALVGPADTATGEAGAAAAGPAGPGGLTAATAAIIAADAAVTQEQALSGLQGVVQTWQQELVSFKQVGVGAVVGAWGTPRFDCQAVTDDGLWLAPTLQLLGSGTGRLASQVSVWRIVSLHRMRVCQVDPTAPRSQLLSSEQCSGTGKLASHVSV